MPNYVVYTRTHAEHVVRARNLSTNYPYDLLKLHFHEASLTGFPEKTVFWINREGPSVGFALCSDMHNQPDQSELE
ncbi:hypothetical protein SAMN05216428_102295 [Nitrosospira sp. Nsp11]|uniref:hypothetical protein n=1 Tax=Nitrosospira sp. Nsp11 TaxID=1855338 RepID=UPI00091B5677|nr:hypothetical protein [Nitrosospira sp. Nsp11]SHL40459.1 hypothetical protein SAMN05216428_102295 [Nitrosospira sp. Nsp11]